jgi:hypothetical protein
MRPQPLSRSSPLNADLSRTRRGGKPDRTSVTKAGSLMALRLELSEVAQHRTLMRPRGETGRVGRGGVGRGGAGRGGAGRGVWGVAGRGGHSKAPHAGPHSGRTLYPHKVVTRNRAPTEGHVYQSSAAPRIIQAKWKLKLPAEEPRPGPALPATGSAAGAPF